MTPAEYADPKRFPLTTKAGVTPREQLTFDRFNLAQLRELRDDGHSLTDRQKARLAELERKAKARPELFGKTGEAGDAQ